MLYNSWDADSLEPTFSSKLMRDLATEPRKTYEHLGLKNGRAFIGMVADFRAADFASDVPGAPISATRRSDHFELEWFVSSGCTLKTVIIATGRADDAWKNAHRIQLKSINFRKEELA